MHILEFIIQITIFGILAQIIENAIASQDKSGNNS